MCGNYLLWGKDKDGTNSVQKKIIEIKTKNGTWDKKQDESLDALLEQPSFNETLIYEQNNVPIKVPREVFSREKALKEAPPSLIPIFKDLFNQIDKLDLLLNFYDLAHNKRKNPPRKELLQQFTEQQQKQIKEESTHINPYKYLKLRHLLVELRRQQFSLKDSYSSLIQPHTTQQNGTFQEKIEFGSDITILPLGLNSKNSTISSLIFRDEYIPNSYTEQDLKKISDYLWGKKNDNSSKKIDFRELEHVYNIFLMYFDLEDETLKQELESETDSLLKTLDFYINLADLSDIQKDILNLKLKKVKNQDISSFINKKYNKSYTSNYISTIFRQKIIKQINDAARFHEEIIGNLFFPENFKVCSCCKKSKLRSPENFVRKSRSKDGYSNKCKKCDKKEREERKKKK